MDVIDKLYTLQKQAGKSLPNKILDWLGWLKKVDVPVDNITWRPKSLGHIPLNNTWQTVNKFDAKAAITDVAAVSAIPTGYGVCAWMADDPAATTTTDTAGKTDTTVDPADTTTTDTAGKTDTTADPATTDKTDTTADAKQPIYDQAVTWIKENPWLAAAIGAGGLGLGYYAFSNDEEDEEE